MKKKLYVKVVPDIISSFLKPGKIYEVSEKVDDAFGRRYYLTEIGHHMLWDEACFVEVKCPCDVKNCITHR